MSQARRILHEARNGCEAKNEGRRKIKRLLPVHCSGSSAHFRPQVVVLRSLESGLHMVAMIAAMRS